jgi:DnaA family protein
MKQLPLGVQLRATAVYASFAAGGNEELLAALRNDDSMPVWLWGGHGFGKTHLLQAVCAAAGGAVAYVPLGGAAVSSAARHSAAAFPPEALAGFEACRVVCLDDVDAVAGDAAWEEALFRLFNAAADARSRLIFAAQAPPSTPPWHLEDWRSRAASCVVYQLRPLDESGIVLALRLRAAQRGLELPPETADYLLRRLPRDVTTLLAILDRLDEASLVAQRRLTIPFIRDALETLAETAPARKTSRTPASG